MAELVAGKTEKEAFEAIEEYWEDKIAIVWQIDDVQCIAKDMDIHIADDQAIEVLQTLQKNHDAEYGICWETIRYHVQDLR
jgi:hypothetical protein